jgi:hypothetical protein
MAAEAPNLREVDLHDGVVEGSQFPLVPPGEYIARYVRHETAIAFTVPKLYLHFDLIGPTNAGTSLFLAFRVRRLIGDPQKNGRFAVGHRSELYVQLARLAERPMRRDRISLRGLRRCLLRVRVRTVKIDYRQRQLPENLQYSVIAEMLGIEVGSLAG